MTYGKRTLIAVDQLLNTLLGGWPDNVFYHRHIVFLFTFPR